MKRSRENVPFRYEKKKYEFPEDFFAGIDGEEMESLDAAYPLSRMASIRFAPERNGRKRTRKDQWS